MEQSVEQTTEQSLTEQQKITKFAEEYNTLCKQYGLQIVAQPTWVPTNHGSFEMTMQMTVVKIGNV